MPARLADNPYNDPDYKDRLQQLPIAERERLLNGDWNIPDDGELFQRNWFTLIEPHQVPDKTVTVRYWDLAATEPSAGNPDPDWTVGVRLELDPKGKLYYLTDIVRIRKAAGSVEEIVRRTAERDGKQVAIVIEQEGGAAGKAIINHYTSDVLRGYNVRADRPSGHKYVRAQPVAAAAENGLIRLVRGAHTTAFLDELSSFPNGRHDDCVDALAGAHDRVTKLPARGFRSYVARGRIPSATETHLSRDRLYTGHGDPIEELAAHVGARYFGNTKR
jgi:predicted phage terminase large subunit-like protein